MWLNGNLFYFRHTNGKIYNVNGKEKEALPKSAPGSIQIHYIIIIHHWFYSSGESSNQFCVSVGTHMSVTAGRNFLILGIQMGYGLCMMPVTLKF